MTQQNILELAKQGNAQAIASLMNRQLQHKGITAKVALKDACLQVMLESAQVPDQQGLVAFVRKGITGLGTASVERVKVYGRQVGEEFPAWNVDFEVVIQAKASSITSPINTYSSFSSEQTKNLELPSITQKKQKTNNKYYEIEGSNGQIRLTSNRVIISRKGTTAFITQGLKGDKEIPISRITAMQFKRADALTKGYLQFSIHGSIESKGGIFAAVTDENTIMFTELEEPEFDELKRYVNSVIDAEPIDFDELRFVELKELRIQKNQEQQEAIEKVTATNKEIAKKLIKPILVVFAISYIVMYFSPDDSALKILSVLLLLISGGSAIIAGIIIVHGLRW